MAFQSVLDQMCGNKTALDPYFTYLLSLFDNLADTKSFVNNCRTISYCILYLENLVTFERTNWKYFAVDSSNRCYRKNSVALICQTSPIKVCKHRSHMRSDDVESKPVNIGVIYGVE